MDLKIVIYGFSFAIIISRVGVANIFRFTVKIGVKKLSVPFFEYVVFLVLLKKYEIHCFIRFYTILEMFLAHYPQKKPCTDLFFAIPLHSIFNSRFIKD